MSISIHILLLLLTVPFIYTEEEDSSKTLDGCIEENKCFINGIEPKCIDLRKTSYKELKKEITEQFENLKISDISQVHCNTRFEQCLDLAPSSGHKKKCTDFTIEESSSNEKCCYMTVEYEDNKKYSCYPAPKDKNEIDNIIKILKKEYAGSEKISIDCNGKFISLSLALLFFFLL
jgi:hypothetical protein